MLKFPPNPEKASRIMKKTFMAKDSVIENQEQCCAMMHNSEPWYNIPFETYAARTSRATEYHLTAAANICVLQTRAVNETRMAAYMVEIIKG